MVILSHKNEEIAAIGKNLLPVTYALYQDIRFFYHHHRLQYSGWTAHQRVTGHISTTTHFKWDNLDASILLTHPFRTPPPFPP